MTEIEKVEAQPLQRVEASDDDVLKIAIERGVDADQLEKIVALVERREDRQALKEFVTAHAEFLRICPQIKQTAQNKQFTKVTRDGTNQPSNYATLDDVMNGTRESLSSTGLRFHWTDAIIEWNEKTNREEMTLSCVLTHIGGHSVKSSTTVPVELHAGAEKSKTSSLQLVGISMTYAHRYTLISVLAIPNCDPDTDGNNPADFEPISKPEIERIAKLIKEKGVDKAKFLKWLRVKSIDKISMSDYPRAIKQLEKR